MRCPKCDSNQICGCVPCRRYRRNEAESGRDFMILDGDNVKCGNCGWTANAHVWLDEEYKQYEEFKNGKSLGVEDNEARPSPRQDLRES